MKIEKCRKYIKELLRERTFATKEEQQMMWHAGEEEVDGNDVQWKIKRKKRMKMKLV